MTGPLKMVVTKRFSLVIAKVLQTCDLGSLADARILGHDELMLHVPKAAGSEVNFNAVVSQAAAHGTCHETNQ
eukprot:910012-Amphidinium_carterae.1